MILQTLLLPPLGRDTGHRPLTPSPAHHRGLTDRALRPRADRFQTTHPHPTRPTKHRPLQTGVEPPILTESRFAPRDPFAFAKSRSHVAPAKRSLQCQDGDKRDLIEPEIPYEADKYTRLRDAPAILPEIASSSMRSSSKSAARRRSRRQGKHPSNVSTLQKKRPDLVGHPAALVSYVRRAWRRSALARGLLKQLF